jgi:hypothetical protein
MVIFLRLPVSVIRIDSARKLKGYGESCWHCRKPILDMEYIARTRTHGTAYYHFICAQSLQIVDNLDLLLSDSPFKPVFRANRILSRGLRKKFIFFSE